MKDAHQLYQSAEVEWYRQHGRFTERIDIDGHGQEYVIGDFGWFKMMRKPFEPIETRMSEAVRKRLRLEAK